MSLLSAAGIYYISHVIANLVRHCLLIGGVSMRFGVHTSVSNRFAVVACVKVTWSLMVGYVISTNLQ